MKISRRLLARVAVDRMSQESPQHLSRSIAAYLLENGQTTQLDSLMRDIQAERAYRGEAEILVDRSHPLPADVKTNLRRFGQQLYPRAQSVRLTEINNPDLIGGVRLRSAEQQLDLSLAAKLSKFKSARLGTKD